MYVPKCMTRTLMITVRRQLPPRKNDPQPKTNPNINSNPNQGGGQFSSRVIVWLSPNSKTNPNLDTNPNSNQGATFLRGQLSRCRDYSVCNNKVFSTQPT